MVVSFHTGRHETCSVRASPGELGGCHYYSDNQTRIGRSRIFKTGGGANFGASVHNVNLVYLGGIS